MRVLKMVPCASILLFALGVGCGESGKQTAGAGGMEPADRLVETQRQVATVRPTSGVAVQILVRMPLWEAPVASMPSQATIPSPVACSS